MKTLGEFEAAKNSVVTENQFFQPGGEGMMVKRPKYMDLLDAIEKITQARLAVESLCDEICGVLHGAGAVTVSDEEKVKRAPLSLLVVLDEIPAEIHKECQMIISAVNEIKSQIL